MAEFSFCDSVLKLTSQIPVGKVSTYKGLAIALGDEVAARCVGGVLGNNPTPVKIPCHRVVHSDGRIGGYKLGVEKKIELLEKEGHIIKDKNRREDAKIENLKNHLYVDWRSDYPLKKMKKIQNELSSRVIIKDVKDYSNAILCGTDVAYDSKNGEYGFGVLVVQTHPQYEFQRTFSVKGRIEFPYIPTYLSFREMPIIEKLIGIAVKCGIQKDRILLMVDGNGILHPRGIGIASHIGVKLDIATIGIAKRLLCGEIKGDRVFVNAVLCGRKIGKVYVSPGHKISLETATSIVKKLMKNGVPKLLRQAHIYAKEMRRMGDFG